MAKDWVLVINSLSNYCGFHLSHSEDNSWYKVSSVSNADEQFVIK